MVNYGISINKKPSDTLVNDEGEDDDVLMPEEQIEALHQQDQVPVEQNKAITLIWNHIITPVGTSRAETTTTHSSRTMQSCDS